MGRGGEPAGDLGEHGVTWEPPADEQGLSNRAGDRAGGEAPAAQGGQGMGQGRGANPGQRSTDEDAEEDGAAESNRAKAKDQDYKAQFSTRNRPH
jgi:hypothetical protein